MSVEKITQAPFAFHPEFIQHLQQLLMVNIKLHEYRRNSSGGYFLHILEEATTELRCPEITNIGGRQDILHVVMDKIQVNWIYIGILKGLLAMYRLGVLEPVTQMSISQVQYI